MGAEYSARCQKCGHTFSVMQGGGFAFHLLRCDKCGKEKWISFGELIDLHNRSISAPNSAVTADRDGSIPESTPGPPLSEAKTEALVGKHRCGGRSRFDAPPRCPKCRSTDIEFDERGSGWPHALRAHLGSSILMDRLRAAEPPVCLGSRARVPN